ncbi:btb/poz-like protein [Coniochaeta ligniaria NRRL 30616]|uniref:Btb/poz-like protein n=1 Tax=Coniochaeta ligniaria NRRL 30616 TaxID=1408157 RepID=A0A1J7IY30_9PEZI|nr:btb/poz-like protein [Coniochaeta ligniaria NRRL 30616]
MDSDASGKSPAIENIVPDGDVIMVLGPEKREMRVSSQSLRYASKVFDIMLGPNWGEGQGLSKINPPKVTLEEDEAESMRTIFYVLHHRNDQVSKEMTAAFVLDLAIASDKYDLGVALWYANTKWLDAAPVHNIVQAGYMLTAAFLFGNADKFEHRSLRMVLYYVESYLELLKDDKISQFLPFKAICK